MAKTVDITASYIGSDITSVDVYNTWPNGTLLSGSFTGTQMKSGIRLTGIADSIFDFVLVDTATSQSSNARSLPSPSISEFNPTSGVATSIIGVTGSGFIGLTGATLGGQVVTTFVTSSNTRMEITVPASAFGSTLTVTNPKGTATINGWEYAGNVNTLGNFIYNITADNVCAGDGTLTPLYATVGSTIEQALENQSLVYTDSLATELAATGWYRKAPSEDSYIYYVDANSKVTQRSDCSAPPSSGGSEEESENGGIFESINEN